MKISYDPAKSEKNTRERAMPFDLATEFDFSTALIQEDARRAYPERRFAALGFLGQRLCSLVFTPTQLGIRVISLRKANARERKRYDQAQS